MPDPVILSLTGVEVEARLWRGTDNTLLVTCEDAAGNPLNLSNYNVTMTIVDRPGGTVMFSQTKVPGQHLSPAEGKTLITVGAAVTAGLTEQRPYTWKHTVLTHEQTTGQRHIHFHGDVRVLAPATPVVPEVLRLLVFDASAVTESQTVS